MKAGTVLKDKQFPKVYLAYALHSY